LGDVPACLKLLKEVVLAAAEEGAVLLLLPELFLGGYYLQGVRGWALAVDAPAIKEACAAAKDAGVALVFGFPEIDGERVFNSAMAVSREGEVLQSYRKTHLFGEAENTIFSAGDRLGPIFPLPLPGGGAVQCALAICYDVEFPEVVRELALQGCELVLCVTANMFPYQFVNTNVVPVRAYENSVAIAYCNYGNFVSDEGIHFCGLSSVCDADGEKVLEFGEGEDGLKVAEVPVGSERVPGSGPPLENIYHRDRRPELYTNCGVARTRGKRPAEVSYTPPLSSARPGKGWSTLAVEGTTTSAVSGVVLGGLIYLAMHTIKSSRW
jgi:predicted amidohydrolase